MREYFKAFKDKPITHVIELKSANPRIIAQLKKEMAEEGVADQSVAISFSSDQLKRSAEQMPELTGGFLNSIADSADALHLRTLDKLLYILWTKYTIAGMVM